MALSSTRTYTWQDLDDENPTGLGYLPWSNFTQWTGNGVTIDGSTGSANLVHTTTEVDLGSDRDFYIQASAESVGTHSFVVQVNNIDSKVMFDVVEETFDDFSVGATATTLPITRNYSRILNMNYTIKHDVSGLQKFVVAMTDVTKTAPKVISYDMDTWGKVATATTADITLKGFPRMTVTNGNISVG